MAVKTVKQKLEELYALQAIDSKLDQLRAVRGELPLEVADLEDELAGLNKRLSNFKNEVASFGEQQTEQREQIRKSEDLVRKYKEQLNNIKNNREFDALNKEIEIQELTGLAAEKKIKELDRSIEAKNEIVAEVEKNIERLNEDLESKKNELEEIIAETQKEEEKILVDRSGLDAEVDGKLLKAYSRIRGNVINGIAVAPVLRGACGGCFARIPPQLQSDIKLSKKIVLCENCGRINIDARIAGIDESLEVEEKPKRRAVRRKV
jgi:predicted  nucleic acid-binding Zn-ribbon protein